MKLREDVKIIATLLKNKVITENYAKELARSSLMVLPENGKDIEYENFKRDFDVNSLSMSFEQFPLLDMVALIPLPGKYKETTQTTYCRIELIDATSCKMFFMIADEIAVELVFEFLKTDDGSRWIYRDYKTIFNKNKFINPIKIVDMTKQLVDKINLPSGTWCAIMSWMIFNNISDKYAIKEQPLEKFKHKYKEVKMLANVAGPRIIYLDKLPEEINVDDNALGVGSPKAPHQRRGTWCTLRAERYKNHPLYQVEKAIYRKPAWVGDRTRIVHGATYTVIDKQIKLED